MAEPVASPPKALPSLAPDRGGQSSQIIAQWRAAASSMPARQPGGRMAAEDMLRSFLDDRGHDYHRAMSSPLTAETSCSRLSAHLAWGSVSMREVVQAARARRAALDPDAPDNRAPRKALHAFLGRLHWHCHFMQKLEDEPRLEFENLHSAYDGLREAQWCDARFAAWREGRTGLPFVDACMRYLRATGWLNFRMRAMLVAVSSYHLWLHWREPTWRRLGANADTLITRLVGAAFATRLFGETLANMPLPANTIDKGLIIDAMTDHAKIGGNCSRTFQPGRDCPRCPRLVELRRFSGV